MEVWVSLFASWFKVFPYPYGNGAVSLQLEAQFVAFMRYLYTRYQLCRAEVENSVVFCTGFYYLYYIEKVK